MTRVVAAPNADTVCICGTGLRVSEDFPITPEITIRPTPPRHELQTVANGCDEFSDYAAIISMMPYGSFYIEVRHEGDGRQLAAKAWNSLWLFHLLGLACKAPCDSLYAWSGIEVTRFSVARPYSHFQYEEDRGEIEATHQQLAWTRRHLDSFEILQKNPAFVSSLRSYSNAHHLFGLESRIMLLWAGIECLFKVSNEISRTLALYSALLLNANDSDSRYALYKKIKKEYDHRSKVVHGTIDKNLQLREAYESANEILVSLLARCVEISRVPTSEEFDRAALVGFIGCPTADVKPMREADS
jgi:hypothetical protein